MARAASGLATRCAALLEDRFGSVYGRGVHLRLSKTGRKLYGGLIGAAAERDAAFRRCLTSSEKLVFEKALAKLAGQAREFIQQEKK